MGNGVEDEGERSGISASAACDFDVSPLNHHGQLRRANFNGNATAAPVTVDPPTTLQLSHHVSQIAAKLTFQHREVRFSRRIIPAVSFPENALHQTVPLKSPVKCMAAVLESSV